jgi:phage head maturation protease
MPDLLTRAASLPLSSFDPESREIDAVLATETPVRRRDYDIGEYDEILVVSPQAIDASRMDAMALIDSHNAYTVAARLGTVVPGSLRFVGKTAVVRIKLSRNDKGEALFQDLVDGHRLSLSVGYKITKTEITAAEDGRVAVVRAATWIPLELSVVSIPADPAAMTRHEEKNMPQAIKQNDSRLSLTERRKLIGELAGVETRGFADEHREALDELARDTRGMTGDDLRDEYLAMRIRMEECAPTFPHSPMHHGSNNARAELDARQQALVSRFTGKPLEGDARRFAGASLLEHARGMLANTGVDVTGLSRDDVLERSYHTTSDFPALLTGTGNRVLMDAYDANQSPLKTVLSRSTTMSDFRAKSALKVTDAGLLEKINESGEITSTTRGEVTESYKLETFARMFSLSRQAIINDDLGAFGDWGVTAGRMAALTEASLLFKLLTANSGAGPKMGEDNQNLFHSSHGNLLAAAPISVDALSTARLAMRTQKALGSSVVAGIRPAYLLVGPKNETAAEKVLAQLTASEIGNVNPFSGKLELLVEPQIADNSWYVFAAPGTSAVLEYAYLSGAEGPQLATREGFDRLGTDFRCHLDFGCGALDYRGAIRNPGA